MSGKRGPRQKRRKRGWQLRSPPRTTPGSAQSLGEFCDRLQILGAQPSGGAEQPLQPRLGFLPGSGMAEEVIQLDAESRSQGLGRVQARAPSTAFDMTDSTLAKPDLLGQFSLIHACFQPGFPDEVAQLSFFCLHFCSTGSNIDTVNVDRLFSRKGLWGRMPRKARMIT